MSRVGVVPAAGAGSGRLRLVVLGLVFAGLTGTAASCSDPAAQSVAAPSTEPSLTFVPSGPPSPAAVAAPGPSPAGTATATAEPVRTATAAAAGADPGPHGLDRFVAAVQVRLPDVALDRRDDEIADLGQQACDQLAAGKKTAAVAGSLAEPGVSDADARALVALARDTACPA
jgi:hypothetical protein